MAPGPIPPRSPDHPGSPGAPGAHGHPGRAPFLVPGRRVVLRYAIDRASSPHGEGMTDALGTVLAADERTVTVMTRRGEDRVERARVIAAKEVPPPPVRRRSRRDGLSGADGGGDGAGSE